MIREVEQLYDNDGFSLTEWLLKNKNLLTTKKTRETPRVYSINIEY